MRHVKLHIYLQYFVLIENNLQISTEQIMHELSIEKSNTSKQTNITEKASLVQC